MLVFRKTINVKVMSNVGNIDSKFFVLYVLQGCLTLDETKFENISIYCEFRTNTKTDCYLF